MPLHPAGYYSGGQDYYTHMESGGFDLHVDQGANCGANCSVVDWPNKGVYRWGVQACGGEGGHTDLPGLLSSSTLIYGAAAVDIIESHDPQKPLFLYLAFQARASAQLMSP